MRGGTQTGEEGGRRLKRVRGETQRVRGGLKRVRGGGGRLKRVGGDSNR